MEAKHEIAVVLATDKARSQVLLSRTVRQAVSTLEHASVDHLRVDGGVTRRVELGSVVSGRWLYLETDGALTVFDADPAGGASGQVVAPLLAGEPGVLLRTGSFEALWLRNAGTAAVQVVVALAGVGA